MKRADAAQAGIAFIRRMGPVLTPIFSYLESGSLEAYKFIDGTNAKSINGHLFSGIVRDHACRKLDDFRAASNTPFTRIYVANSGIRVYYDRITLKVLRPGFDEDGDAVLPPPKSDQQVLFYTENHYVPGGGDDIVIQNLVMLWQSDHTVRSTSAWLACPEEGHAMLFCEPIPHPATAMHAPPPPQSPKDTSGAVEDDLSNFQREDERPDTQTSEREGDDE